jgi:hypothetical protein
MKLVGYGGASLWSIVNDDRDKKRSLGDVPGAIRCEAPLAPEITLVTGLGIS